uniref:Uncharacterized protein n=1 Tax=Anguilla anguilla TaxID=7936 RepID=A0A0E9USW2_ANGAN
MEAVQGLLALSPCIRVSAIITFRQGVSASVAFHFGSTRRLMRYQFCQN